MEKPVRIAIAGGGTGGHLFPGLAVAEQLRARGAEVFFVGTQRGLEAKIVPQYGYPLHFIEVSGIARQSWRKWFKSVFQLPQAAWQARNLLHRLRPQAVLGVGGYASGPIALLAAWMGIPTALLEQNAIPGLANRWAGRWAHRVFTAFPQAAAWFPKDRVQLCGTPLRQEVLTAPVIPRKPGQPLRVLVLGGSQGAHALNQLVLQTLQSWPRKNTVFFPTVVHQTGATDASSIEQAYQEAGFSASQVRATAFINNMGDAYANADLVISRAGATTLAELTARGLPSVLIPLPTATHDHQTHNARSLAEAGATKMLVQAETTPTLLRELLLNLMAHPETLIAMGTASKSLGKPQAAVTVAEALLGKTEILGNSVP